MKLIDSLYDKMNDIFMSIWNWLVHFFTTGPIGDFLTSFLSSTGATITGLLSSVGLPILVVGTIIYLLNESEGGSK